MDPFSFMMSAALNTHQFWTAGRVLDHFANVTIQKFLAMYSVGPEMQCTDTVAQCGR